MEMASVFPLLGYTSALLSKEEASANSQYERWPPMEARRAADGDCYTSDHPISPGLPYIVSSEPASSIRWIMYSLIITIGRRRAGLTQQRCTARLIPSRCSGTAASQRGQHGAPPLCRLPAREHKVFTGTLPIATLQEAARGIPPGSACGRIRGLYVG
jgi:hypothetical protein